MSINFWNIQLIVRASTQLNPPQAPLHSCFRLRKRVKRYTFHVFTRRRSFAEYWKYFVARLNDVQAFVYNFAGSERIWMTFGELRVYCLELALADFGRDPRRSESGRPLFFCQVNNARLCRFPVSLISRNLHTRRGSVTWWILSEYFFLKNCP